MLDTASLKQASGTAIRSAAPTLTELSHALHAKPELAFEESYAAARARAVLQDNDFAVSSQVPSLPTAFSATCGSGPLVIAFFAEYDALPGMGHACGHNIIAASSIGAAIGLSRVADELDITVKVFGTPAEEGGGGKVLMLESGYFDGIHAALMVHPAAADALRPPLLGHASLRATFTGRQAHAASYPENGRNAADAVTLTQVAIGLLRQHIRDGERISGVPVHGWAAANIIPAEAEMLYSVRSGSAERLDDLRSRVADCCRAGALASGTAVCIGEAAPTYLPMVHDDALLSLYASNWTGLGGALTEPNAEKPVYSSSDFGNVSQLVAAITPTVALGSGVGTHEPEFAGFCNTDEADRVLLDAALALAGTGIDAAAGEQTRRALLNRPLTRGVPGAANADPPRRPPVVDGSPANA